MIQLQTQNFQPRTLFLPQPTPRTPKSRSIWLPAHQPLIAIKIFLMASSGSFRRGYSSQDDCSPISENVCRSDSRRKDSWPIESGARRRSSAAAHSRIEISNCAARNPRLRDTLRVSLSPSKPPFYSAFPDAHFLPSAARGCVEYQSNHPSALTAFEGIRAATDRDAYREGNRRGR